MLARRIEQGSEKQCRAADLLLDLQILQRKHNRCAVLPDPACQRFDFSGRISSAVDYDMAEMIRQPDEITFWVDNYLLHLSSALFEQSAQQMRFSRA